MLVDVNLDQKYWIKAVQTAIHSKNVSPIMAVSGITPYEKLSKDKPNLEYLRFSGCCALIHIPKVKHSKWDEKSEGNDIYSILPGQKEKRVSVNRSCHL